jgi:hypothetical protein
MKLFRKKKDSGSSNTAAGAHGSTSHVLSSLSKGVKGMPSKPDAKKEEAQRRFVKKLYQLSHAHAANSLTDSLPEMLKSDSSSPAGSSPTAPCSVTPDTTPQGSPTRAKPRATRQANPVTDNKRTGVFENIDAVFNQFTACTSDFFGEGIPAECVNGQEMGEKGRTIVSQYPPVPATITFESALLPTPTSRMSAVKQQFMVDRSSIDGTDELDGIVELTHRVSKKKNIAYKPITSSGSSLIDNVWVVSSFAEERPLPVKPVVQEELSITSSIPTRISHRL